MENSSQTGILPFWSTSSSDSTTREFNLSPGEISQARETTQFWCRSCWDQLPDFSKIGCPTCGAFVHRPAEFNNRCSVCLNSNFKFSQCVALSNYEGLLKQLVVSFKGNYDEPLAVQLGKLLGYQLERHDFLSDVDFLLPIPTHWKRRFKRGFHAAGVIAEGVKTVTRIPIQDGLVSCQRMTEKQGMLSEPQRFANVKNGFKVNCLASVTGAKVLVIDDVMTSGATMSEVANELLKAGASEVFAGVVARGTRSR